MYQNSTPVAVVLQQVRNQQVRNQRGKFGVIVIQRGNPAEDGHAQWAFPGGYVEIEDIRVAGARELKEEIGIIADPEKLLVQDAKSVPDGTKHLIFLLAPAIAENELPAFNPNGEVLAVKVIYGVDEVEWAYPLHRDQAEYFFC